MRGLRSIFNLLAKLGLTAVSLLCWSSPNSGQAPAYDRVLKGGHVIDPANNVDAALDVAVASGKIAAIAKEIPAGQAKKVVDVKGLYVVPGLIDIHYHIGHGGAPLDWFTGTGRVY